MTRSRCLTTLVTCLLAVAACIEPSAPAAVAVASDSALVREGATVHVDVAANDTGSVDAQVRLIGSPLHGSATASGSIVSYVPVSGYLGADSVRYVHNSAAGDTAVVRFRIFPGYAVAAIGAAGGGAVGADVNDSRMVAGTLTGTDGSTTAFRWSSGAPVPLAMPSGAESARASAINSSGTIVGFVPGAAGSRRSLLWRVGQDQPVLPPTTVPSDGYDVPIDVDDSELVLRTDGMLSSSLWDAPASTVRGVAANGYSIGVALDANGTALFNRTGGSTPYNTPAVRRADGSVQGIGSLGRYASASHMNAEGHVVGRTEYGLGSATTRPFIWTATGGMRELTSTYGSWLYGVHRINSLGWMLGSLSSSAGSTRTPGLMIGSAAVPIADLLSAEDRARWTILGGIAINDRGDILVHAADRMNGGELPLLLLR